MSDLVSIGLPVYNGAKHIKKTIITLLEQSYKNIELIISDDASEDNSQKICKYYAHKDKRIKFFQQKKKTGIVKNFNFVLKKAQGEYFMWSGNDDFWHKNFIKTTYTLLKKNPDAVLAVSNFDNVYKNKYYHHRPLNLKKIKTHYTSVINFLKSGELSYFYGLHRTKNIKNIVGYQADSRPFFKSSDYLTILRTLLGGRMVYTKKILFFKRDTGYHFTRFSVIKNFEFNKKTIKVILRFLCFPVFFIYNFFYSIKYVVLSRFNCRQKIVLLFYVVVFYIKSNLIFLVNILWGMICLFTGFFRKIV